MNYYVKVTSYENVPGCGCGYFTRSEHISEFDSYEEASWHLINAITHNRPSHTICYFFELSSDLKFNIV